MQHTDNDIYTTHIWFIRDTFLAKPAAYRTFQVLGQEQFRPCRQGWNDCWTRQAWTRDLALDPVQQHDTLTAQSVF